MAHVVLLLHMDPTTTSFHLQYISNAFRFFFTSSHSQRWIAVSHVPCVACEKRSRPFHPTKTRHFVSCSIRKHKCYSQPSIKNLHPFLRPLRDSRYHFSPSFFNSMPRSTLSSGDYQVQSCLLQLEMLRCC